MTIDTIYSTTRIYIKFIRETPTLDFVLFQATYRRSNYFLILYFLIRYVISSHPKRHYWEGIKEFYFLFLISDLFTHHQLAITRK